MYFTARLTTTLALIAMLIPGCSDGPTPEAPSGEAPAAAAQEGLREVPVAEASAMFTAGTAAPVDANSQGTRESRGVVPGATLLSSGSYELSELPQSDLLIFYCSNTNCSASDRAAERARDAGREVAIMREGIAGWVEAGQPVDRPGAEEPG